jgi:hypothetical protein
VSHSKSSLEGCDIALRKAHQRNAGAAKAPCVKHKVGLRSDFLQAIERKRRGRIQRPGGIKGIVLIAREEYADVPSRDFVQPMARARRQREAKAERHAVLRQGASQRDSTADQARAVEDTSGCREQKAASEAPARHLGCFEPCAVDGVFEILDAIDRDSVPGVGLGQGEPAVATLSAQSIFRQPPGQAQGAEPPKYDLPSPRFATSASRRDQPSASRK